MKRNLLLCVALIVGASVQAADSNPGDEVAGAVKKLAGQPGYSWKTTVTVPDGARFRPGPTEGKTERQGLTHVVMSFGENKSEMVLKGDKAAIKGQDGNWQSVAALENAEGPGRFGAMMARNFKAPAEQAQEIAGYAKDLKKDGEAYAGALTEEGAKTLLTFRRRAGTEAPQIANPSGSVKFWVKDGMLTKYEFKVKGTVTYNNNDMEVDRATLVEIKDVGQTKVQAPPEALEKLS